MSVGLLDPLHEVRGPAEPDRVQRRCHRLYYKGVSVCGEAVAAPMGDGFVLGQEADPTARLVEELDRLDPLHEAVGEGHAEDAPEKGADRHRASPRVDRRLAIYVSAPISRSMTIAALRPGAPHTPPPGWMIDSPPPHFVAANVFPVVTKRL